MSFITKKAVIAAQKEKIAELESNVLLFKSGYEDEKRKNEELTEKLAKMNLRYATLKNAHEELEKQHELRLESLRIAQELAVKWRECCDGVRTEEPTAPPKRCFREEWGEWFECPVCGGVVNFEEEHFRYCPECGQKMDWGENGEEDAERADTRQERADARPAPTEEENG